MAAPVPGARTPPSGFLLREGFKSTLTFASQASIQLWEREVKPPSMESGDPIDISTMFNSRWLTFFPRKLVKAGNAMIVCGYDPAVESIIINQVGSPDTITVTFPTTSTLAFYGALMNFDPQNLKIGEFPLANVTIMVTNWDNTNNVEAGPVYTASAGTP